MQITNILEYLEDTVRKIPEKTAFSCEEHSLTFTQLYNESRSVGSFLADKGFYGKPVVVFMKKTPRAVSAFLGVIYAGCFYVALDEEMPRHRIELIIGTINAEAVICDDATSELIKEYGYGGDVYLYNDIAFSEADEAALASVRDRQTDPDPIYAVFT